MFWIYFTLTLIVGLCVGSFLNVVIYRLPNNMSVVSPASHCPNCKNNIKWYDNIPVLSYIFLGGKCRNCKTHISFRYTLVELLNALLWALCFLQFFKNNLLLFFVSIIACSVFICVAFIDIEHKIIFDRFNLIILVLAIVLTIFGTDVLWWERLIGFGCAVVGFVSIFYIGKLFYKKEVIGGGDIKFVSACGLLLGWKGLTAMIFTASVVGAIVLSLILIIKKKDRNYEFPFAPFLTLGAIIGLLYITPLTNFYLGLL